MLKNMISKYSVVAAACTLALSALAAPSALADLNVPAGELVDALRKLATQADVELVYQPEQLKNLRTNGVKGNYSVQEAVNILLQGTSLRVYTTEKGAMVISSALTATASKGSLMLAANADASAGAGNSQSTTNAEGAFTLEEIIVSAQKRTERLQDVPMSISVVSGDVIERRSMVTANDLLKYVPGVEYQEYGAGDAALRIRGIDGGVGVYVGEMPVGAGADLKLVDMERVEILRGPQGTLYGAGSMGGTVRYIPTAPNLTKVEGDVDVGFSKISRAVDNSMNVTGAFNMPLISDKLAVRVAAYHYDNAGYIDYIGNTVPEQVSKVQAWGATLLDMEGGGQRKYTGARVSALWQPLDNFSAAFMYVDQRSRQDGSFEDSGFLQPYQDYPLDLRPFTSNGQERRSNHVRLHNLTLKLDLGAVELTSSSSYSDSTQGQARDAGRDTPWALVVLGDFSGHSFAQELRADVDLDGPFNFMIGGYYERGKGRTVNDIPWVGSIAALQAHPDFGGLTDPLGILTEYIRNDQTEKAVFGELYYDVTEQLKLTVGGRHYSYDKSDSSSSSGLFSGDPTSSVASTEGETFKGNLTYSFTSNFMVYGQWAEGFRPAGPSSPPPNPTQCDTNNDGILDDTNVSISPPELQSDTVEAMEFGGKSMLAGGRVVLSAAVYRIDWDGIPSTVSSSCGASITLNAGKARSEGFEFESNFAITPHITANVGFSLMDGKLLNDVTSLNAVKGDKLIGPPHQVNVGLEYGFPIFGYEAFIRGDYSRVGKYRGQYRPNAPYLAGYGKLDFRVGIQLGDVNAALYGTNLTNEDALLGSQRPGYPREWHLQPREVGVQFGYRF